MKKLKHGFWLAILACMTSSLLAQDGEWRGAERTYAIKLGTTKPLRDLLASTPTAALKLSDWKSSKPEYVRNFIGRRQGPVVMEGSLPVGADPLLNLNLNRDGEIGIVPRVNVEGISQQQSGSGVPDVNGDVSDQYYVQTVNSTWLQVFDLAGNEVGNPFLANTIWQQLGFSSAGDPIILFDQQAGRWFMTEFPSSNRVLVAVSADSDPFGQWTAYAFSTPTFPDYPKYGIWPNAYVLSTNEGGGNVKFYTINRQDILSGADTVDIQRMTVPRFPSPSWQTLQPVDWNGMMDVADDTHPMFMRINDDAYGVSPVDRVEVYEVIVDWDDEDSTVIKQTNIPTAPYDSEFCSTPGPGFSCIPQPNGVGIDGIPYIFMNAIQYRNFGTHSSIVGNFAVDVTGDDDAGVRWMELRKAGTGDWELYQEGTVGSLDGLNRFMGGISIDGQGNIGLAYSVSSETYAPSLRFTGRRSTDPLGQMTVQEYEFAKGAGSRSGDRFGDYASMSVDNQDMFWYTGEYVRLGGAWSTKIVGFKLERAQIDIGPGPLVSPVNSPSLEEEFVSVCIINHGVQPQDSFVIGLITPDGTVFEESVVVDSLLTDSMYCHTFAAPVDFTAFGPHEIIIYSRLATDLNTLNDTCRFVVIKQTTFDASIPRFEGLTGTVCDTFVEFAFVLKNIGVAELTEADIIYEVNQGGAVTIEWTGSLAMDEEVAVPVVISGLNYTDNEILVYTSLPGTMDQDMMNDTLLFDLFVTPGGQRTTLFLTTDNFPEETSWQVIDSSGNVTLQGGPYNEELMTFTEEWCLDTSQCYRFVILDLVGDGISSFGGDGDFQIVNGEGVTVADLDDPNFGLTDTTEFCLKSNCTLTAAVFVRHEDTPDGQNGSIRVFASGGLPPLQYSIDGGMNFQSSTMFNNLAPGTYQLLVRDGIGCSFEREVIVFGCDIQIMAEVVEATGSQIADGSVALSVTGGNGPLEYSINGGQSFQAGSVFINLLPDTFNVVVRDDAGCEVSTQVIVDFSSAVKTTYFGSLINVYPNPTSGYVNFEVQGLPGTIEIMFDILSADGKIIRSGMASNYSGVIKGSFSLMNKPSGEYYLRFRHNRLNRLIQVIKIRSPE